ncbi:MAG TPA: RNB domain-containing ribonuclease, partial [Sorangium sp.]|nr:RNB domain-containing ribonuclease [Sorangium sp.]
MKTSTDKRTRWVGELVERADGRAVRQLFGDGRTIALPRSQGGAVAAAPSGSIVEVRGGADEANQPKLLAAADSALAQMYHIAARHQLDPVFPVAVERQVAALVAAPGLNDPELIDMRAHAFVTIDGPGTRDLDQALYVAREDGHLVVYYALADAAWCVTPGTPLFDEALRRGATYYLPGFSVPMLPRALSEGIVSLNEKVDRRALVFRMTLDKRGVCSHTELKRALIRSRGKLTFEQVDKHLHHPATQPFEAEVARCLQLFQQVGELRLEDAERRDVIHYRRTETEVTLDKLHGCRFVIVGGMRTMVERYNEQLSLLCNVEGAHYL